MKQSKGLDNAAATRASIWMKTGACVGGTVNGYMSQWLGRRRTIIFCAFMTCCLIAPWILPDTEAWLSASGFFIQFFVQGAFGVIPIHLNELAPPEYRSTFPGLSYQIGNMISSPSAQIANAIAEKVYVKDAGGPHVKGYGPTMGIATAIIAIGIMITAALGPERFGRNFEAASVAGANETGVLGPEIRPRDVEMVGSESSPAGSTKKKEDSHVEHSALEAQRTN
jgi:sugar phosphate permease